MSFHFIWQFPEDHPALAGHFPGQPIAPGAVLLDRLALFSRRIPGLAGGGLRLEQAKFLRVCKPGDMLAFVLEARDAGGWAFRIECDANVLVQGVVAADRGSAT
jgi:3-hydroxymyristoyl/3-hydroxydecanoyl-(acyl carrier protein) dehydratase